ncbi:MAG TPA: phosphate-starvation-inducible PsiE family protein [Gaiellaceae bacterium]|nr:phosphate-starvation-inducible PsiE family protein [Gaiellaceae bacterium]
METPVDRPRYEPLVSRGLVSFELFLYVAVGALLAVAAAFVLIGTLAGLVRELHHGAGAVDVAVVVLDRILLALIVAELVYTLRFVIRTHEIAVEPFLYIGLIAVVRRILVVTAEFEGPHSGRAATNLLLEFGVLGLLVPGLASAVFLVRRGRPVPREQIGEPVP